MSALYGLVEAYAAIGPHHRTGTAHDASTIEWFASEARRRGASVEIDRWTFDRFDATTHVTVDGAETDSIALYYSALGRHRTPAPRVADLESMEDAIQKPGAPVVCPTGSRLFAANAEPVVRGDVPAVFVQGEAAGKIELAFEASLVEGSSANVVASWGAGELVIGTPLSGWFTCAGERGTGIAIALELAARLGATLVGTSGHELNNLGLRRLRRDLRPRAILHLGASLAARGEDGELSGRRWFRTRGVDAEAVRGAWGGIAPQPIDRWLGEAVHWAGLGTPLVSFAGTNHLFHTPDDTPARATSPELLERVFDAVLRTAQLMT